MKHITDLTFKGYSCFKDKQEMHELGDINFIIGPNNSGKTRILYLVSHELRLLSLVPDGEDADTIFGDDASIGSNDMEWEVRFITDASRDGRYIRYKCNPDVCEKNSQGMDEKDMSWFVFNAKSGGHQNPTFIPHLWKTVNTMHIFQKRHIQEGHIDEFNLDGVGLESILYLWQLEDDDEATALLKETFKKMETYSQKCEQSEAFQSIMSEISQSIMSEISQSIMSEIFRFPIKDASQLQKSSDDQTTQALTAATNEWSDTFSNTFGPRGIISVIDFLRLATGPENTALEEPLEKWLERTWTGEIWKLLHLSTLFGVPNAWMPALELMEIYDGLRDSPLLGAIEWPPELKSRLEQIDLHIWGQVYHGNLRLQNFNSLLQQEIDGRMSEKKISVDELLHLSRYVAEQLVSDTIRPTLEKFKEKFKSSLLEVSAITKCLDILGRIGKYKHSLFQLLNAAGDWRNPPVKAIDKLLDDTALLSAWHKKRRERFNKINKFLQAVSDVEGYEVELSTAHGHETFQLWVTKRIQGKLEKFPLSEVGAGVQDAIMLAAYSVMYENAIVCIEEPELHLHPAMQHEFVKFLLNETPSNQYFIATHSASLINTLSLPLQDSSSIRLFTVQQDKDGYSSVKSVKTRRAGTADADSDEADVFDTLFTMGYQAADILQANCLIMVEGPSDEIYLEFWIRKYLEEVINKGRSDRPIKLHQGLHYQYIRSGGNAFFSKEVFGAEKEKERLEKIARFVQNLRQVNKHLFLVFDRDWFPCISAPAAKRTLLKKKRDILQQAREAQSGEERPLKTQPGWITWGREIENYVPADVMASVLKLEKNLDQLTDDFVGKGDKTKTAREITGNEEYKNLFSSASSEAAPLSKEQKLQLMEQILWRYLVEQPSAGERVTKENGDKRCSKAQNLFAEITKASSNERGERLEHLIMEVCRTKLDDSNWFDIEKPDTVKELLQCLIPEEDPDGILTAQDWFDYLQETDPHKRVNAVLKKYIAVLVDFILEANHIENPLKQ